MGNINSGLKAFSLHANTSFPVAFILILTACTLGWVSFLTPNLVQYTTISDYNAKFGVWYVCSMSLSYYANGYSCTSWFNQPITTSYPDFITTVQALLTTGMCFATLSLITASLSAFFQSNLFKLLPLLAGIFAFGAFILIIIAMCIFSGDYIGYILGMGGYNYSLRWSYYIFMLVIVFCFLAAVLFPILTIHKYLLYRRERQNSRIRTQVLSLPPIPQL